MRIAAFLIIALLCTGSVYSHQMMDGISYAKSAWFIFLSGLLLIFLTTTWARRNFQLKFDTTDVLVGIYSLYAILNSTAHDSILFSLKNIEICGLITVYFFTKQVYSTQKDVARILSPAMLVLTLSQLIVAALQWYDLIPSYNENFQITGFFFNPAPFAIFLAVLLLNCLVIALFHTNRYLRAIGVSLFILGMPIILISLSRAAWISTLAAVLVLLELRFCLYGKLKKRLNKVSGTLLVLLVLSLILVSSQYLYNLKTESADGRLLTWKLSLKLIGEHPLNGVGKGHYAAAFLNSQSNYFRTHTAAISGEGALAGETRFAFNDLLQSTAELGIPGLAIILVLLFFSIKMMLRLSKSVRDKHTSPKASIPIAGAIITLIVITVSGLFSYPLTLLPFQVLCYYSLAVLSVKFDNTAPYPTGYIPSTLKVALIIALYGSAGMYVGYSAYLYRAYTSWQRVKTRGFQEEDTRMLFSNFPVLDQNPQFLQAKGNYFLKQKECSKAIRILEAAKTSCADIGLYYTLSRAYTCDTEYLKAEQQLTFIVHAVPGLLRPKYILALFYYQTGQWQKFRVQANEVISFNPKIRSFATDNMAQEIRELVTLKQEK